MHPSKIMRLKSLNFKAIHALTVGAILSIFSPASAATVTWDANAATASQTDGAGAWLTANQWWNGTSNVTWTSGDDAVFGNGGTGGAVTLASGTTIGSLTFNSFSGTYTIGTAGQTITLNNGITMNSGAGAATILSPVTLGAAQSWLNNSSSLLTIGTGAITNAGHLLTVGGSGNTTISSVLGGTGGLTKQDGGILTLSGANTFSGQLTVANGTLAIASINNVSANGTLGNSALSVILGSSGNTATLLYTGSGTGGISKIFSLATGGTGVFEVTNATGNLNLSGVNTGSGNLSKTGAGVLILSGANNYTGTTTINAGALQLGYGTTSGSLSASSAISVASGAIFAINRSDTVTQGTQFSGAAISGDGGFSQYGSGTTVLNATNTYKGATTMSGGTLSVGAANNLGDAAANLVFNGGSLQITGTTLTSFTSLGRAVVFSDSKVVALDINNAANTFTFDLSLPTAGLSLAGAGNVNFQNSVSALTLNIASGTRTYGGAIGDGSTLRSITKTGGGTQELQGNSGYTGSTTINAGTLSLSGTAGRLSGTSGITLNGGGLTLTNITTQAGVDRVNNAANIVSNGGAITVTNTAGTVNYSETLGALDLRSGQLNITQTNNNNSGQTQTLTLGSGSLTTINGSARALTDSSAITFSGASLGAATRNSIFITSQSVTAANQIVGPWATFGTAANAQTDYATYNITNGTANAFGIQGAGILGSTEDTWTTAANAYTTSAGATVTLTGTRSITALRNTGGTTVLTLGIGANLETYGLLNGVSTLLTVATGTGGVLTTPTGGGNLFVTAGSGAITISAPINNNGGNVALVKSGSGTLTLSSSFSNYSGGSVINAGTLVYSADAQLGANGSRNVTFAGSGTLTGFTNSSLNQLTVNSGAVATISSTTNFAATTGSGNIVFGASANLGNASNFYGSFLVRAGTAGIIQFASLGDTVGSGNLQYGGRNSDAGQTITMALSGDTAPLTLNNRRIEFIAAPLNWAAANLILQNNNATAANKFVINSNLLNNTDRNHNFQLGGTNTGDNEFAGLIGDSTFGYMYDGVHNGNNQAAIARLSLIKAGAGKWIVSGNNTFTGSVSMSAGTLVLSGTNAYIGATTLTAGTLQISSLANGGLASNIGASSNAAANLILNGGTLRYTGAAVSTDRLFSLQASSMIDSSGTGAVNFTNTGSMGFNSGVAAKTLTLTGTNTGNNTIAAVIGDNTAATAITKTGIGTWVLSGTNINNGPTGLSGGGSLILDYTSNDTNKIAGILTLGGGTLTLKGATGTHAEAVTSTTLNAGGNFLTRDGANTTKLRMNAITRAAGGTISFGDATIADTDTNNFGTSGANGILGGWATLGSDWAVSANTGAADTVITALASYTSLVMSAGVSTTNYQLTGSQTQSGATAVGSLRISNNADSQTLGLGNNNLTITSTSATALGGILYAGGNDNSYTISNGGGTGRIVTSGANQELIFNAYTGTLTVNAFVGLSGSSGIVTKSGAGTLVFGAANDYTGITRVNEGALRLTHATGAGTVAGGITVQNGAALEMANGISVGAEALSLTGAGISSGGALRNIASNTSSYAGAITLGAGGARINSDSSGSLTLTGGVVTSLFNDVTFGGAGSTTVSTAAISGAGGLVKDGLGILTLSGTNTYTGATTIDTGKLLVHGSTAVDSAFTVNNGATLGGSGTINGTVTLMSGATLSPGASIESLGTGSNVWNGGSTVQIEFSTNGSTGAAVTEWDQININGTLDLTGATSGSPIILDLVTMVNSTTAGLLGIWDKDVNATWTGFVTTTGGFVGFSADKFSFLTSNFANTLNGTFSVSQNGNNLDLNYTATVIPEPKAALLGGLGILLLLRRRR
jgi:fibronectin-binding autotransporter adhesin